MLHHGPETTDGNLMKRGSRRKSKPMRRSCARWPIEQNEELERLNDEAGVLKEKIGENMAKPLERTA
jgi:hypothetical protein